MTVEDFEPANRIHHYSVNPSVRWGSYNSRGNWRGSLRLITFDLYLVIFWYTVCCATAVDVNDYQYVSDLYEYQSVAKDASFDSTVVFHSYGNETSINQTLDWCALDGESGVGGGGSFFVNDDIPPPGPPRPGKASVQASIYFIRVPPTLENEWGTRRGGKAPKTIGTLRISVA